MTCKWLITMVIVGTSPKDRVMGPLPNGRLGDENGGYQLLTNWDDPSSNKPKKDTNSQRKARMFR